MDQVRNSKAAPIKIYLAPMEGVVDPEIRNILTSFGGIDVCATEFIRVTQYLNPAAVFYKLAPELKTQSRTENATPVFLQLLGSDLNCMAENAQFACELGAHGIDINFGCPAKTVNRHDGGSVILKNPERVFAITSAVRKAVPAHIPVTTKVRLGFEHKDFHKEIALAAEEAGSANLVVHARTKLEAYRPPAHWEYIANMKDAVNTMPVVANGDIWSVEDYFKCREISGCSDIMLGRGLMAQPLLALQIRAALGEEFNFVSQSTFLSLQKIFSNLQECFSDSQNLPSYVQNKVRDLLKVSKHVPSRPDTPNELEAFYLQNFILKYYELHMASPEPLLLGRLKQLTKLLSRHSIFFHHSFERIKRQRTVKDLLQHLA